MISKKSVERRAPAPRESPRTAARIAAIWSCCPPCKAAPCHQFPANREVGPSIFAPKSEVFDRLHLALDSVADVVLVDAAAGLLIGDLRSEMGTGRLVVEVHSPVDRTEPSTVEFTLDQLGANPAPPIDDVVRELARLVRGA